MSVNKIKLMPEPNPELTEKLKKLTKEEVYKMKFTNYASYSVKKVMMYNFYRFAKADVRIENTLIGSQIFAYNQNKDL
jgi:hypothetical protein